MSRNKRIACYQRLTVLYPVPSGFALGSRGLKASLCLLWEMFDFLKSLLPPVCGSRHVSNSLVQLRTATCVTVLVKKMVSLHCFAKNVENDTCGVYLCICKDTSAFFILIISPSITHHKKVNLKEFHMCMCWWCAFLSDCLLDSQHLPLFPACSVFMTAPFPHSRMDIDELLDWLCLLQASQ